MLQGNLGSCNPGGYFLFIGGGNNTNSSILKEKILDGFDSDSSFAVREDFYERTAKLLQTPFKMDFGDPSNDMSQTFTANLRSDTVYYVNLRVNQSLPSDQNGTDVILTAQWNTADCKKGQEAGPSGCQTIEDATPKSSKKSKPLTLNTGDSLYYSYSVETNAAALNTLFNFSSSTVEADDVTTTGINIAIRRGGLPDMATQLYDVVYNVNVSGSHYLQFNYNFPQKGLFYFQVWNPSSGSYEVSLTANSIPNVGCTDPSDPTCVTSNATASDLSNITSATIQTGNGNYQYFFMSGPTLKVGTGTKNLKAIAPSIVASPVYWPSNESNFVSSMNRTVNLISAYSFYVPNNDNGHHHKKDDDSDNAAVDDADNDFGKHHHPKPPPVVNQIWYVAISAPSGFSYYLWSGTSCANNCQIPGQSGNSTHGACDETSGYCQCNKHYGNLWCTRTGLATVWIVLIVIACAIVLAVAIGVPVACYLKNRRRARYERV